MANRCVGNVIIVDSAMGNLGVLSTNYDNYYVSGISFWFGSSAGSCSFSLANTADHIIKFSLVQVGTGVSLMDSVQERHFSVPLRVTDLKVPVLSAGTAWVYLA